VLGILAGLFGAAVQADEQPSNYVMNVIDNKAQGEQVISGEYEQAIENIIAQARERRNRFAESNNLCVAYAKTNELQKAVQACDEAVQKTRMPGAVGYYDYRRKEDHSVALSNRGVVRAVSGDIEGARQDFVLALQMNSRLEAPAANLAHLQKRTAQTVSSL
jgi:tetratricopeptide (TPR) repeat protein